MARRPAMSSQSFFDWVSHPKSAARPTGVRKTTVKNTPTRKAARVRAYNNLDPLKQQILVQTGQRDEYLRGETTLAKARRSIVDGNAVTSIVNAANQRPEADKRGQQKGPVSSTAVAKNVAKMSAGQRRAAERLMGYQELLDLINDTRDDDGYSPFFYK